MFNDSKLFATSSNLRWFVCDGVRRQEATILSQVFYHIKNWSFSPNAAENEY